jgi:hypothetical protein
MVIGTALTLCEVVGYFHFDERLGSPRAAEGGKSGIAMEAIEILFKEYDTLRTEIISSIGHTYQLLGLGVALTAVLLSWMASSKATKSSLWIMPSVFLFLFWLWWKLRRGRAKLSKRLCEIESEINAIAGAELLKWETRVYRSRRQLPWFLRWYFPK